MVDYRRVVAPGATYFFTLTLHDRCSRALVDHVDLLRIAFANVRRVHPFRIDAIVVLPEHLHTVLSLPEGDADFATRWRLIKTSFTRDVSRRESVGFRGRDERTLWARRFWEHRIRDEGDLQRHVEYVHFNPVKHGWVEQPALWPFSSLHRALLRGTVGAEWAGERQSRVSPAAQPGLPGVGPVG